MIDVVGEMTKRGFIGGAKSENADAAVMMFTTQDGLTKWKKPLWVSVVTTEQDTEATVRSKIEIAVNAFQNAIHEGPPQ